MAQYRKKPVVIEAMRLGPGPRHPALAWLMTQDVEWELEHDEHGGVIAVLLPTLEGTMRAARGDWIIKGVQGEFYPCKPDIFDATYEPVGGDS